MNLRKVVDVAALVVIGVCIGGLISEVSTAERYLSDWQTLIAGILAVVAAAWTVGEMRRNDTMQQVRHEELMQLNLRADRLRARRAALPAADEIAICIPIIVEGYRVTKSTEFTSREHKVHAKELYNAFENASGSFGYVNVSDAKDMFGSHMSFTYYRIIEILNDISYMREIMLAYVSSSNVAVGKSDVDYYIELAGRAASYLDTFAKDLRQLAAHYGPD